MKKLTTLLLIAFASVAIFSCGDDESPKNQFSAEGDSYSLKHGYYILSEEGEDDDGNNLYVHSVYLTSKDLEITTEDGIDLTGSGDLFAFSLISDEDDIAEGSYEFGDDPEAGTLLQVIAYTGYNGSSEPDNAFGGEVEGTLKVSKSGGKYTFKATFTSFQKADGDETVDGEGSLKLYFRGEVEEVTPEEEEPLRKPKDFKSPFAVTFKF